MDRLMYGIMRTIQLDAVRDKFSNNVRGYSFVQEPTNKLHTAYLDIFSGHVWTRKRAYVK